jgi:hypothetical protein
VTARARAWCLLIHLQGLKFPLIQRHCLFKSRIIYLSAGGTYVCPTWRPVRPLHFGKPQEPEWLICYKWTRFKSGDIESDCTVYSNAVGQVVVQLRNKVLTFHGTPLSLSFLDTYNCLGTELYESSRHQHALPIEGPFNIIFSYTRTSSQQSLDYRVFQLKFCTHLLIPYDPFWFDDLKKILRNAVKWRIMWQSLT